MCYEVKCKRCGKRTWAGCGRHKDNVLANIPENERCECPRENSNCNCKIIWKSINLIFPTIINTSIINHWEYKMILLNKNYILTIRLISIIITFKQNVSYIFFFKEIIITKI